MDLVQQIENNINQSLKAKDQLAVLTLRQVKTAIGNAEIAKNREKMSAEDVIKVLKSEVKKRKDAIELYKQGGREELAQKEQKEIDIIAKYLPPEMSEEEIVKAVEQVIGRLGEVGPKDMGKVMSQVMAQLKGQADGNIVSRIVKEKIG